MVVNPPAIAGTRRLCPLQWQTGDGLTFN